MGAIDTVKDLAFMIQKLDNVELLKQVVSLQQQVYDLADENRQLKERLATRDRLSFKKNSYWKDDEGPFCSRCWDADQKLVRLHVSAEFAPVCPKCKNYATDPDRDGPVIA